MDSLLQDLPVLETWHNHLGEGATLTKVLLRADKTESVLDQIEKCCFKDERTYRVVILPVEATLPRPEQPDEEDHQVKGEEKDPARISTEEIYQKLSSSTELSGGYILMMSLASFIAALGLLRNDAAVVIGSMVLAPLLNPNKALALATTLADTNLARRSTFTIVAGIVTVLLVAVPMGFLMGVEPVSRELALRSDVRLYYIALALASGTAGAYTVVAGIAEALVGVMVAVALLPPLVATGLFAGAGRWEDATGALLLFLVNIVGINLSGVVTFAIKGVQPKNWWEAEKASKAVKKAVAVWVFLLVIMGLLIVFAQSISPVVAPG